MTLLTYSCLVDVVKLEMSKCPRLGSCQSRRGESFGVEEGKRGRMRMKERFGLGVGLKSDEKSLVTRPGKGLSRDVGAGNEEAGVTLADVL